MKEPQIREIIVSIGKVNILRLDGTNIELKGKDASNFLYEQEKTG